MIGTLSVKGVSPEEDGIYEGIPICAECSAVLEDWTAEHPALDPRSVLVCPLHGHVRFMRFMRGRRLGGNPTQPTGHTPLPSSDSLETEQK